MKKLLSILFLAAFTAAMMSCTPPTEIITETETIYQDVIIEVPVTPPEPSPLIGKWRNGDRVVEFQSITDYTGYFWMYSYSTNIETATGFYTDHGDYVYLEDPIEGVDITYLYEIVETAELGVIYSVDLRWWVDGGGVIVWGMYE